MAPVDSYGAPAGVPDAFRTIHKLRELADAASDADDAVENAALDPEWLAEGGGLDVSDDSAAADAAAPAKARGGLTPPAPVRVLDTPVTLFEEELGLSLGKSGGGGVSGLGASDADVLRWFERNRTDAIGGASALAALKEEGVIVVVSGRGLLSFPFQLNLSSSVHRMTQLNSGMCPGVAQVEL